MKKSIENKCWQLARNVDADLAIDRGLQIEDHGEVDLNIWEIQIFSNEGHCWNLIKEKHCEPEEVESHDDVEPDGCLYTVTEPWRGFTTAGTDKLLSDLVNLEATPDTKSLEEKEEESRKRYFLENMHCENSVRVPCADCGNAEYVDVGFALKKHHIANEGMDALEKDGWKWFDGKLYCPNCT
jgi:hypothetical protein